MEPLRDRVQTKIMSQGGASKRWGTEQNNESQGGASKRRGTDQNNESRGGATNESQGVKPLRDGVETKTVRVRLCRTHGCGGCAYVVIALQTHNHRRHCHIKLTLLCVLLHVCFSSIVVL